MPQLNGIDATAQILHHDPDIRVIILSMYADEEFLGPRLDRRVKGYLLKDAVQADLLRAVRAVATGRSFFSPAIAQTLAEDYVRQLQQRGLEDSYELLTEREREVLQLLAEGKSNKEVATVLNVSPVHCRDAPHASDAEAKPSQYGGNRAVCCTKEDCGVRALAENG